MPDRKEKLVLKYLCKTCSGKKTSLISPHDIAKNICKKMVLSVSEIDEIMAKLDELNVDVSRSAVGRHCKRLESIQASIRQSRTIAEAIVKDYGDEDKENKVARANIEVLHSILFRMMGSEDGEPVTRAVHPIASLGQMTNSSNEYIYVRGGGQYYFPTAIY